VPGGGADGVDGDRWDDPPPVEEWFAGLEGHVSGPVKVLAEPAGTASAPAAGAGYATISEPARLAAELGQAVEEMGTRLGSGPSSDPVIAPVSSLTVAVEADHPAQIRHTGRVGEAVAGGPADLHIVHHPEDGFAYRHGLARVLIRATLGSGGETLPPYLLNGAALWLADPQGTIQADPSWYGRPWRAWLPALASAAVLPTASELLTEEALPDGSFLLWTPVAAALVAELPGDTLAAKLADRAALGPAARRFLGDLTADSGKANSGLASGATTPRDSATPDPVPPFLAGVSLAMLNDHELGYQSPSVDRALAHLDRALGADSVSLMPFAYQPAPDRPAMRYLNARPGSETDVAMIHAGRRADARGFTVLWKPQIWLRGSWPGEVAMTSEDDWAAWFRSYRRFVVHQAVLARWVGAEIFSVGVELGATVEREVDWRRLIAAVRSVYDGPLTYSANWYGDFDRVPFWNEVDFLGIDAYEPLTDDPEAGDAALAAGARRVVANLEARARRHRKPLLLTEVGFAAHEAAWVAPHEEGGPLSHEDQARAYRALFDALGRPDWLRGVFLWKAFSNASGEARGGRRAAHHGEPMAGERADFRFLHRPAEEVVEGYFRGRD